jgi:hypothetical protein
MEATDNTGSVTDTVKNTIVANVTSAHDVEIGTSLTGVVNAEGDSAITQSGAGAIVARGDAEVSRSGSVALVASSVSGDHTYSAVTLASDVAVSRSWIGVALSPRMQVSEDSRVLVGPVAALIIVVAALGVFGIVAVFGVLAAKRALAWRPKVPAVSWHRMGE